MKVYLYRKTHAWVKCGTMLCTLASPLKGGARQFPAVCAKFAKSNLWLIWRSRQWGAEGLVGHNGYGIVNIGLEMDPNGGASAGKFPSSATGGLE